MSLSLMTSYLLGMALGMLILNKYLHLSDPSIGFVSSCSPILASLMYAFVLNSTTIYLSPVADMFNVIMFIVARSMLSKLVEQGDVGKAVSLTTVLEILAPMALVPLYNQLYRISVGFFSGVVFLFSIAFTLPAMGIFM